MYRKRSVRAWALATIGLIGCTSPTGYVAGAPEPGVLQLVGYDGTFAGGDDRIRWDPAPANEALIPYRAVDAPDTVAVGASFDVTTTTIGLNGCWTAGGQSARTLDSVIEVRPHDVHSGAHICTEILQYLPHTSSLTLNRAGTWIIRVHGRRVRLDRAAWEEAVIAEKTIIAR